MDERSFQVQPWTECFSRPTLDVVIFYVQPWTGHIFDVQPRTWQLFKSSYGLHCAQSGTMLQAVFSPSHDLAAVPQTSLSQNIPIPRLGLTHMQLAKVCIAFQNCFICNSAAATSLNSSADSSKASWHPVTVQPSDGSTSCRRSVNFLRE